MPSATNHLSQTSFCNESDEDLLFYMSLQGEDQASAEEAWKEFYVRHYGYLLKACMGYQNTLGDLGVEDLVHETFVRVFKKAHTYERREAGVEHNHASVRAWLGRIANRLFLSSLRGQPLIDFADDPYVSVEATSPATESEPTESEYMPVLRGGLQTLSEREREVLTASYAWYESGTGFKRMPSEELATLCTRFQTTPANIRQIRSRALGKLQQYMEDHRSA